VTRLQDKNSDRLLRGYSTCFIIFIPLVFFLFILLFFLILLVCPSIFCCRADLSQQFFQNSFFKQAGWPGQDVKTGHVARLDIQYNKIFCSEDHEKFGWLTT